MTNKFNFTKSDIEKLPVPGRGMDTYSDTGFRGLKLYVTSNGVKTFFVRKMVGGRDERFILGQYPAISINNARTMALETLSEIAKGTNPNAKKKKDHAEQKLGELFVEFMERYSKKEKKSWIYDEREIPKFYSDWFKRRISDIPKTEIQRRHEKIRDENGLYQANRALERLRAMYNKGIEWGWGGQNPTNGVKKFKEVKRDRFLLSDEARAFFASLDQEPNSVARNYFYMALFTGARKTNVLEMRWDQIDAKNALWRIPDTKNGEPVVVPLIPLAMELLSGIPKESEWVFPSPGSKSGHFEDPKRSWGRILERAGIKNLRIHDIRRTMGSWQALTGASLPIIGKSLGHKSTDATSIYARLTTEPVRDSMQIAVNALMDNRVTGGEK